MMFSSRKKPPIAANFHPEGPTSCRDTSGSQRDSPFEQATPHLHPNLNSLNTASAAIERSARDRAPLDLELLWNLVHSEARHTSEASSPISFTNREREALFRYIRTDADIKPSKTPITAEKTENSPEISLFHTHYRPTALLKPSRTLAQIRS